VARRATIIEEIRTGSDNPVLVLDAGSALYGRRLAQETKGAIIIDAMNALGYDAMAVGPGDLYWGMDVVLERASEADFPVLACNIVSKNYGSLILPPYAILEREGLSFGILGVTEQEALTEVRIGIEGIDVLDPVASVGKYLPEVESQSDVVILLSHLGLERDLLVAQALPGIDIIVGGRSRILMGEPERAGDTVIVQAGYNGEWVGRLEVGFDEQGQVLGAESEFITLGPEVAEDPELRALVDEYERRYPEPTATPLS
jgi:2',3'-cyclic-nucleotide 2'-phosphodiesterase (5'-nucleotidase family)